MVRRRGTEQQFRALFEAAPIGAVLVDITGRIELANAQMERMFGYDREELIGQPIELLVPERLRPKHVSLRATFYESAQTRPMGAGREFSGRRKNGSEFPIEVGLSRLNEGGRDMVLATIIDITQRREAEERQKLLIDELQHRTQNIFSVVQSLASSTLTETPRQERLLFLDRLQAVSRTYALLSEHAYQGAPLGELIRCELSAFPDRTRIEGANVVIRPDVVQSFALVVHELTTNAFKHGSLSVQGGNVHVRWTVSDSVFQFSWQEHGGPAVMPPIRSGFGQKLLDHLARQFGEPRIEFANEGLRYEFKTPLPSIGWLRPCARTVARAGTDDSPVDGIGTLEQAADSP